MQKKAVPSYAKWGSIALIKTKEKYPHTKVVDYLYIGRVETQQASVERFKFCLKEGKKEYGVFVNIRLEKGTERMMDITLIETST